MATQVEQWVVDLKLEPGDRVTTMDDLRQQTKLGRATISEAARLLAERGTVEVRPGRGGGLFVAEITPTVRLRHTLLSVSQDPTRVAHSLAVRDALEELIDVDAARYRTKVDVQELEAIVERMKQGPATRANFLALNWQLHRRLAQITPNEFARGVYLSAIELAEGSLAQPDAATSERDADYVTHRIEIHAELVAAVAAGDAARAARAATAHRADDIAPDLAPVSQ